MATQAQVNDLMQWWTDQDSFDDAQWDLESQAVHLHIRFDAQLVTMRLQARDKWDDFTAEVNDMNDFPVYYQHLERLKLRERGGLTAPQIENRVTNRYNRKLVNNKWRRHRARQLVKRITEEERLRAGAIVTRTPTG